MAVSRALKVVTGRFVAALAPEGEGPGRDLRPTGDVVPLGDAVTLLGAEASFNPVRSRRVRSAIGPWTTLWRLPEA